MTLSNESMPTYDWHRLHPAVARIRGGVTLAIGAVVAVALATVLVARNDRSSSTLEIVAGSLLLALVPTALIAIAVTWRCRSWRYRFGDDALEVQYGVWWRTLAALPYQRIQQVEVEHGPLQRRFGVVSLALRTASARSLGSLPGVAVADAEQIRQLLLQRAGRNDGA